MQFLKLFWLTFTGVWKEVIGGKASFQVHYENLQKMIRDDVFSDSLVEREFFRFCERSKSERRLERLLDAIGKKRPQLFQHLAETL